MQLAEVWEHQTFVSINIPKAVKHEEHISQLCLSESETELHFINSCRSYQNLRRTSLSEVQAVEPMFLMSKINEQFYIITNNSNIISKTATFIVHSFKTRSDIIFNGE